MSAEIRIPKLGMIMKSATVVEWKAKEGELVKQDDSVLIIETEKIRWDVKAEASGFLHILVQEGNEASVGTIVGLIAESEEELAVLQKETPKEKAAEAVAAPRVETTLPREAAVAEKERERIRISPVARKMAEEHAVDITKIVGTGPGRRIIREDIEKAIGTKEKEEVAPVVYQDKKVKSTIPLTGTRKIIAEHMHHSLSIAAQLTVMGEIDMTEMIKLRNSLLVQEETLGTRITYTDLLVLTVAKALKDNPIINSSLIDNEIKLWENINIGVAVALEEGLIVPVVRDADKKTLIEISQTIRALVDKARSGNLTPDGVTGGTFTITNLGALGGGYRFETVIINQPESAILGTGGMPDRAVVRDAQIVIRPIMTYYFTYDHRVFTGAVAAKFMASVTRLLENPSLLLA